MNDKYRVSRTALSSLYYRFPGSIFTRYGNTFEIRNIFRNEETDDELINIKNMARLKHRLKDLIVKSYGKRIQAHDMTRSPISTSIDLEIRKYNLNRSDNDCIGGYYNLYPIEFICRECRKIIKLSEKELSTFNGLCACSGRFEQNYVILFCEKCGIMKRLTDAHYCSKHDNRNVRVNYTNRTSLRTWTIECVDCLNENNKYERDVFSLYCNHKNYGNAESNADSVKMRPLTVRDGGLTSPANIKSIDFKTNIDNVDSQNFVMLAIKEDILKLDELSELIPETGEFVNVMDAVNTVYHLCDNSYTKNMASKAMEYINESIEKVKEKYTNLDVDSICDLMYLKNDSESRTYDEYLKDSGVDNKLFSERYDSLRKKYHISEIIYLDNIQLVSSTYGSIHGPVKHYDKDYTPHFEPFWTDIMNKKNVYALSYPFKTEGVMIELDPLSIIQWLELNKVCILDKEALENPGLFLNRMDVSSEEFRHVNKLIHTISHVLIKKSVLFTGLDEDSYGELLFPSNYSFIIYSTSTVNIGGMEYLFNYHMPNWFSELDTDTCDCVFDPSCLNEEGACFNCLHLPEYVCSNFNNELSRVCLIGGRNEYEHGFWRFRPKQECRELK